MKISDISIDLETLGTRYDSAILSIGAVALDRKAGVTGPTFYAEIDIDECLKFGRVQGATLAWWAEQDTRARRVFGKLGEKRTMYEALRGLSDLIRQAHAPCVWGNGATFDITILEHAYDKAGNGLIPWWQYTKIRDVRTIVDAAGIDPYKMAREGVHHNAVDDAIFQAKLIIESFRVINKGRAALLELEKLTTTEEDDEL